jgi:hypothetical protein
LDLSSVDEMAPVISDSFLGGSAPRLRLLDLSGILFPALPKLLLSATDLVLLSLEYIPYSGYISPKAMVACLSALTRLESLFLGFRSPRPRPSRAKPPPTRTILPSLTFFRFKGVTEYLEDLVARIDAPLLAQFSITFFNQLVFDLLQLTEFLCRTETFTAIDQALVDFEEHSPRVDFFSPTGTPDETLLSLTISCRELDWQLSSLSQVCNSALLALSPVEYLVFHHDIFDGYPPLIQDDMENTQWLELLHPFTNVKDLHLSGEVPTCIAPALQELAGEQVTEVLPMLENIFLVGLEASEPVLEAFERFVAARQLSAHPVAIQHVERR